MKTKNLFLSAITVLFMALDLNAQNAENDIQSSAKIIDLSNKSSR